MALDTKYRPRRYEDVLGQDATVDILREFVRSGAGFHQGYLFCGPHGNGKTTLGRILARALLCENPQDGNPCDECGSCRSLLEKGSSECFAEMDAATKSGKANILQLTEELEYSTFSGKRRIYLFDEAHQLSRQALDALLKPMEEFVPGTQDKQLVCIFCTTEPEKMRNTVFSRCAPAFTIRVNAPEVIAKRLSYVCEQEGIPFEADALVTIAEVTECHIRDALMAVEAVGKLGSVDAANLDRYFRLDVNETLLKMLAYIGSDVAKAMALVEEVCQAIAPTSAYSRLTEAAMMAYKVRLGVSKPPAHLNAKFVEKIGELHGDYLLAFANCFASRVRHPTASMLALDLARLHQVRSGAGVPQAQPAPTPPASPSAPTTATPENAQSGAGEPQSGSEVPANGTSPESSENPAPSTGNVETEPVDQGAPPAATATAAYETAGGIHIDPRAVKKRDRGGGTRRTQHPRSLDPLAFRDALSTRVEELRRDARARGPAGRHELGGLGAHPVGRDPG